MEKSNNIKDAHYLPQKEMNQTEIKQEIKKSKILYIKRINIGDGQKSEFKMYLNGEKKIKQFQS